MCRKNHLWGCCAGCLGLGLLIGRSLESGLLSLCIGVGLIAFGIACLKQK